MPSLNELAVTHTVTQWKDFQALVSGTFQNSYWIFRGQENESWSLVPSLERATKRRSVTVDFHPTMRSRERQLLIDFKRRAHHYVANPPAEDELLDWFAMMQHHGTPTRLLDWTLSPYVALYFGLEKVDTDGCCIWALESDWLLRRARKVLRSQEVPLRLHSSDLQLRNKLLNEIIFDDTNPNVTVPFSPTRMNERVAAQQGVFLCNLNLNEGFADGLREMISEAPDIGDNTVLHRIVVSAECRRPFLRELSRMNISRASLFPGLDGFARSLGIMLEIELEREFTLNEPQLSAKAPSG
jgi:hypothetical protein